MRRRPERLIYADGSRKPAERLFGKILERLVELDAIFFGGRLREGAPSTVGDVA
jgi:hypothetical protein